MKQLTLFFCIPFIIIYLLVRCAFYPIPVEKTNITDYQYMYEGIVDDWNSAASLGAEREDIFGFGEYLYNSYLLLFPRETPSTLNEYYLRWVKAIDYDDYAIYFTCELSEPNYNAFAEELGNFALQNGDEQVSPIYDDTHFSLPTYLLQWDWFDHSSDFYHYETVEYIMLDEEKHTVVFVYSTYGGLKNIEDFSAYDILPTETDFLEENFSIYDDYENSTYDLSLLDYLK